MTHTSGPWRIGYGDEITEPDDYSEYFVITSIPTGDTVVTGASGDNDMKSWCVGIESLDDARLIAAAPDLLAALEGVLAFLEQATDYEATHPFEYDRPLKARAAIAKARGE